MEILCHNPINNDANRAVGYPGDAKKKGLEEELHTPYYLCFE